MGILGSDPFSRVDAFMTSEHRLIHEQRGFTISRKHEGVKKNEVSDICLCVGPGQNAHLRKHLPNTTKGPCDVFLYRGPTTTDDGTPLVITNNFDGSSRTSSMSAFHTPTVVDIGTEIDYQLLTDKNANNGSASSPDIGEERILQVSTKYLLRLVNKGMKADVAWHLFFYETGFAPDA